MNEILPQVAMISRISITIHRKRLEKEASTYIETETIADNIKCAINVRESDLYGAIKKLLEDKTGNDWIYQNVNQRNARMNTSQVYEFQDSDHRMAVVQLVGGSIDLHNAIQQGYNIVDSIDVSLLDWTSLLFYCREIYYMNS